MFQADLDFRDLGAPYEIVDGALVFGRSFARPLEHRMVHWQVLASRRRVVVIASERSSDSTGVSGEYRPIEDAEIDAALTALGDYPLDYAVLSLDRRAPFVEYRSSSMVSVPAYIWPASGSILIDWDYARLLRRVSVRPSIDMALAQIAGRSIYDTRTVVDGLHRVTADSILTITPTGLKADYPSPVEHEGPREVIPGADLEAALRGGPYPPNFKWVTNNH